MCISIIIVGLMTRFQPMTVDRFRWACMCHVFARLNSRINFNVICRNVTLHLSTPVSTTSLQREGLFIGSMTDGSVASFLVLLLTASSLQDVPPSKQSLRLARPTPEISIATGPNCTRTHSRAATPQWWANLTHIQTTAPTVCLV